MATSKLKNYADTLIAMLQGDEDKTIALKNARKVQAVVKGQISALESRLVDQENTLEEAKEAAQDAKYPRELIPSGPEGSKQFIDNLFKAQWDIDEVEDEIEDTKEAIKFLQDFLAEHEF